MVITPSELARQVRLDALDMINKARSSHLGSNFSIADLLAVLYTRFLSFDAARPKWEQRDRFLLSKGHSVAVLYSVLARVGFFLPERLKTFYQSGSDLLGHAHASVPGIELSTGSLGHALGVATGIALAGKRKNQGFKTVVLLSDGELDEGSVWEAILFAQHHQLSNLYAIIDYNKIQSLDRVDNVLRLEPLRAKWGAFNWEVLECDGHDYAAIEAQLKAFRSSTQPHVLIAHTVKGKGVSFMEDTVLWHYRSPDTTEYAAAKKELDHA